MPVWSLSKKRSPNYGDIWIWPNWWPGVTRIEVLASYNPIPGFQGGTVRHTTVTKMEKIRHGFGHYSSYTFYSICTTSEHSPTHAPTPASDVAMDPTDAQASYADHRNIQMQKLSCDMRFVTNVTAEGACVRAWYTYVSIAWAFSFIPFFNTLLHPFRKRFICKLYTT